MQNNVSTVDTYKLNKTKSLTSYRLLFKDGIIKANLIPAFAAGFFAILFLGHSFFNNILTMLFMVIGVALVIAGVCALNNYYDRDIDSKMHSKTNRPSVDGTFTGDHILTVGFGALILGLICLYAINTTTGTLGLIAAFGYAVVYTMFAKRHLVSNTVIGAIPGAMPPLIGWAAFDPNLHILAFAMFIVMFLWQPPHFYALAIKRSDEYKNAGIPMLPSVKGHSRTRISIILWISALVLTPILFYELGIWFVIVGTILNLAWLTIAVNNFKTVTNYNKYATKVFVFSLNYIIIFFVMIIVAALLVNI